MKDVLNIQVSNAKLRAMPPNERVLFILLGYAANQLSLFSRLIIFSTNTILDDEIEALMSGAQTQMLLRVVIGFLNETWTNILTRRLNKTMIGKDYYPSLDTEGRDALDALKEQFGGSNILSSIRNSYAFHHPYDADIEAASQLAASVTECDDQSTWFFGQSNFNSLYFVSEFVITHGILKEIGENDLASAQRRLMNEITLALNNMTTLIMALTATIWRKHFGGTAPFAEI